MADKIHEILLKHLRLRPTQDEIIRELNKNNISISQYNQLILLMLKKTKQKHCPSKPKTLSIRNIASQVIESKAGVFEEPNIIYNTNVPLIADKKRILDEEELNSRISNLKENLDIKLVEEGVAKDLICGCEEFIRKRVRKEEEKK